MPTPNTHAHSICKSKTCTAHVYSERDTKIISKLAQRTQRQCTGYYCGYNFKSQPVGRRFIRLAAESLNYLEPKLRDKSAGQRWHRLTHRMLIDQQHRCMRRTAPEEWNLAVNYHEQDVTVAEFIRTYRSIVFNGHREKSHSHGHMVSFIYLSKHMFYFKRFQNISFPWTLCFRSYVRFEPMFSFS